MTKAVSNGQRSVVTVIELSSQIAAAEDPDVSQAILDNFISEGIEVLRDTRVRARNVVAILFSAS